MICPNCSGKNNQSANFCHYCGYAFSEEERQASYNETVYGKIDKARKAADIVTLKVITDSIWFRILSIAVILAPGIWLRMGGVHGFRLESSDDYEIQYLEETDTYYLIAEEEEVPLRFVLPYGTKRIKVRELDEDEDVVSTENYDPDEGFTLSVSGTNHYRLSTSNGKKTTGSIQLYLYQEED